MVQNAGHSYHRPMEQPVQSAPDVTTHAGQAQLLDDYRRELPAALRRMRQLAVRSRCWRICYGLAALGGFAALGMGAFGTPVDGWENAATPALFLAWILSRHLSADLAWATSKPALLFPVFQLAGLDKRIAAGLLLHHEPVRKLLVHWPGHLQRLESGGRRAGLLALAEYLDYYVADIPAVTPFWRPLWLGATAAAVLGVIIGAALLGDRPQLLLFLPFAPLFVLTSHERSLSRLRALGEYLGPAPQPGRTLPLEKQAWAGPPPGLAELERLHSYGIELNTIMLHTLPTTLPGYNPSHGAGLRHWVLGGLGLLGAVATFHEPAVAGIWLMLPGMVIGSALVSRRLLTNYHTEIRAWLAEHRLAQRVAWGEITPHWLAERRPRPLLAAISPSRAQPAVAWHAGLRDTIVQTAAHVELIHAGFRPLADPGIFGLGVFGQAVALSLIAIVTAYFGNLWPTGWLGGLCLLLVALPGLLTWEMLRLRVRRRDIAADEFIKQLQREALE